MDGCGAAERALSKEGIPVRILGPNEEDNSAAAVVVATMHRMKGLEFRRVAVVDAGRDVLPSPYAVTPVSDDPVEHEHDMQRERCLVYVACTRAREQLRVSWSGPASPLLQQMVGR
jgi:superfamily I DNA/RNA helicase